MRHRVDKVKLNRSGGHRKGLLNNLVRSLFLEGSITTTISKAKWARSRSEHLISIAKKGTLDSFRCLIAETGSKEVARKIQETTKELTSRTSGFLRLTKVGIRAGDKSVMVKMEFVKDDVQKPKKTATNSNGRIVETQHVAFQAKSKPRPAKLAKDAEDQEK